MGFTNNGGCQKVVNLVGKMVTNYIYEIWEYPVLRREAQKMTVGKCSNHDT